MKVTEGSASEFYDKQGAGIILGETKRYINIGYWASGAETFDKAGDDLVKLLSDGADLKGAENVLDVGCGFGEQDFLISELHPKLKVTAINASKKQIEWATEASKRQELRNNVSFVLANATALPFPDASFDRVICLEAAFHFKTRQRFLAEAYRVLKPGGVIALIDFCLAAKELGTLQRAQLAVGASFWKIPRSNIYPASHYRRQLRDLGFVQDKIKSIWAECYPPFVRRARRRLEDEEVRNRLSPWFRRFLKASFYLRDENKQNWLDYVLVTARRG